MKEKDQKRESLKQDTFALIKELQDVLSLRQIAINTDLSPSTIGYWMKGDVNPSVKSLKTVYDYLLDYKLKRDAKKVNESIPSLVRQAIYSDINNSILTKNYKPIPFVSKDEKQHYAESFDDETYITQLPVIPVTTDMQYKGKYMIFEVDGDSMNDNTNKSLMNGDRILAKNIATSHWSYPLSIDSYFFVILHKTEGLLIKSVLSHDIQHRNITCQSINPLYEDITTIRLQDIKELYYIVELIHRDLRK
ncbi:hypothetical protein [Dysgonomonas massiliensis]|uniref:hypothetical protein n=1 Tax=Dysgonomonas massiliensis TaxID=2040292 RepID=UPI0011AF5AE7|nr:hypothetical protein [Dysgonomonas massiliensis]